MSPTLVILAAGAGSRYGGLKQLASIGPYGETLLEYSAFDALRAGFEKVVLVISRETEEMFRARLDDGMARRLQLVYVHQCAGDLPAGFEGLAERAKPWGTGHAVLAAAPHIGDPFAVVNADDFYGAESYVALARFLRRERVGPVVAAVGFRVDETLTDGGPVSRALLELDDEGHLRRIVEILEVWRQDGRILFRDQEGRRRNLAGDELISMNMWGFMPELMPELRHSFDEFLARRAQLADAEFRLPEIVQSLICRGRTQVEILPGSGVWCGITFREDEERVREFIASRVEEGCYPEELWA
jgi:hypothetical protein